MNILPKFSESSRWWFATFSVLVVALAARLVASTADTLHPDNYVLMIGVEKSFSEYISLYPYYLALEVHYWLSYRVFGSSLSGYLVLSVIASIGTILVVYWGLRRYWHPNLGICFVTLVILALNGQALYLANYAMFTYANSLFLSACLYFLFLRLCMGSLTRRQWLWITACIVPAAFFSNTTIFVPVVAGVFSVIVVRWWQSPNHFSLKNLSQSLVEMWPLAIFPLMLLVNINFTGNTWGTAKRPALDPLYFDSSPYPYTLWGALQFFFNNTVDLFRSLLDSHPTVAILGIGKPFWIVVVIVVASIVIMLVSRLLQRRLDPNVSFTLLFIVVTFSAIVVGGLLGVYPFGSARYAYYLLIPVAVLIGYVASSALKWTLPKIRTVRDSKVLPVIVATTILIFGAFYCLLSYQDNSLEKTQNGAALEEIRNTDADLVLVSVPSRPIIAVRCEDVHASAHRMGHDDVPNEIVESVAGSGESASVKSILVIAPSADYFVDNYPSWSDFLAENFNQGTSIDAPSIWGGYFAKR